MDKRTLASLALLALSTLPLAAQEKPGDTGLTGALSEEAFKALHDLKTEDAPPLHGKDIELGKGKAYLALPKDAKAPLPGVVLIHEWWGLNRHIKHWADRLAADGYAVLAVDLYGGKVATSRDEAMEAMRAVKDDEAHAVLKEALAFLAKDERVQARRKATVGWCFGGAWSLQAALKNPDLDAAVIYYGRLITDVTQLAAIKAEILGVFGNRDRSIPPETVDAFEKALAAAGVKHAIHRYDADHAFANPSGARYDQAAAADAWEKVRAFLARTLKAKGG